MASFSMTADKEMEKSQTENGQLKRLEKNEEYQPKPDHVVTTNNRQNLLTLMPLTTTPETKLCNTRTCYLLTKSNNPVTIENSKEDIRLSDGPSTSGTQMSIIKLTSSKDNPVFICCFGVKTKQSSTVKNQTSESQTSQLNGNASCSNTSPRIISQPNADAVVETLSTIGCFQETKTNQQDTVYHTSKSSNTSPLKQSNANAELDSSFIIGCSKETRSNQPNIVYHTTKGNQTDTSPLAGNLSATNAETDHDSSTIHAGDLSAISDPIEEQSIPSDIHHECTVSQIGQSKPSTIHTVVCHTTKDEQTHASLVAGNLSAINAESDNGPLEDQSTPSNIHHQCKTSQIEKQPSDIQTQLGTIHQSTSEGVSDNNPLEDQIERSNIHNHCKTRQTDHVPTQLSTIRQSIFKPVSKHGTVESCFFETDLASVNDHHQSENGQTSSPSTPRKLPFHDHSTTNTKQSPLKSCYLDTGSWDPLCHHIEYHEKSMALPHDLRYLKESELLPMTYGDFTKCLEDEDLCCGTPPEMMTSTDDDGVVPSSSPLLPGDGGRCYSTCSDTSTDGSQEYTWECFSAQNENIYKSPSLTYTDYPQYGTLNWGLTPTIIYKTPEPNTSLQDIGNDYMKCSISAGNVELLTPPPPNYKKLLRRSRRRMERRHVKRRRIYFGNDENCQGLQEVPVNESEKGNEQFLDTDFVPDDPMWFEDELDEKELVDSNDKPFSVSEQDITDCYENLRNVLPNSEESTDTYQILTEAVEHIKNLEETLDGFSRDENVEITKEEESDKPTVLKNCEDVLEILPQFSWNEIDEPSYEIQEILDNLSVPEEASVDGCCEELPVTEPQDEIQEKPTKRKRKYQRSSRKQKIPRKQKKSSDVNTNQSQYDYTKSNEAAQCCRRDDNSNSQRSDCESVPVFDDNIRSNSSSRSNSQGSRCVTPIYPKPTPGILVSPSVTGFIPLQTIGKPLILPKPPYQDDCFLPPSLRSPLTSPQLVPTLRMVHTASSVQVCEAPILPQFFPDITKSTMSRSQWLGSVIKVPARSCSTRARNKERIVEKGSQKKTIPNGYMLYCKEKRNCVFKENPDLQSKPGDITKLLSENWNQLSEEERRPYVEEAMKLRCDENEWINQTP